MPGGRPKSKLRVDLEGLRRERTLYVMKTDGYTRSQVYDAVRNVSRVKRRHFSVRSFETHYTITRLP